MAHNVFPSQTLRIVCISDTHNDDASASIPAGDILIHAGDMSDTGTMAELQSAFNWIKSLPHKVKILVAGKPPQVLRPAKVTIASRKPRPWPGPASSTFQSERRGALHI